MSTFSIVITAYNREWCIARAIRSAQTFLSELQHDGEIIVVDDASTDATAATAALALAAATVPSRLVSQPTNLGAAGAKNKGVAEAAGEWIVFLDSDDELIAGSARRMAELVRAAGAAPALFFGTNDGGGTSGSSVNRVHLLDLNTLIRVGTLGRDAAPVVRRVTMTRYPYETSLRGCEGIVYQRIARDVGAIQLFTTPIISVHTDHEDRLSSKAGIRARMQLIAAGHLLALHEHWPALSWASRLILSLKWLKARSKAALYAANESVHGAADGEKNTVSHGKLK